MAEQVQGISAARRPYDEEGVRQAVRLFLQSIGEDPEREGLLETPDRIARACRELFSGLDASPADVLEKHFDVDTDELCSSKTSNCIRCANTICCRSMVWRMWAISPRRTA